MAASASRRLVSLFLRNRSHLQVPHGLLLPFQQAARLFRGIQTQNESHRIATEEVAEDSANDPKLNSDANVSYSARSSLKVSARHDLAMIFTCKVCETRLVKTVSRESYDNGVVLARCGGCNNVHLIADRRGWFGEPGSVEDFLAARGEEVMKGSADTLNLTLEDLAGIKSSS